MSTLAELRTEVYNHGFAANVYVSRATSYLNEALRLAARKVDYYQDETVQSITTVAGQAAYPWPTDFAKLRYLRDVDLTQTLELVPIRSIETSAAVCGRPASYALAGATLVLYPTPDAVYNLALRYWQLPALLAADGDTPSLPADYHRLLAYYALQRCYECEDDSEMAQYWQGQWAAALRDMAVDVKFPSTDGPRQVPSMWDDSDGSAAWGLP